MSNLVYSTDFIVVNIKPCSLNHAYTYDRKKKSDTYKWIHFLKVCILRQRDEIDKIASLFVKTEHYMAARYVWFLPKEKLFTKEGAISEKSTDIGNWFKIPDDVIFGKCKQHPGRILRIDDALICIEQGDKLPSLNGNYVLKLKLQIRKIDDLFERAKREWPENLR